MSSKIFSNFDLSDFWDEDEHIRRSYESAEPSDALIESIEEELGYKLPASFIELMKLRNGGKPQKTCYPTSSNPSWEDGYIQISKIMGIGREKRYSMCGDIGSPFMIEKWGYPDTGVYICHCPSAGHDMVMLDYSNCGKNGEPEVVHVDQEVDYRKTFLAKDFETFIRGLVSNEVFEEDSPE